MKTLLIANTIVLVISLISLTLTFINWLKAEKKLAKFNLSKIFKKAGK